jgi:hypothetical protein
VNWQLVEEVSRVSASEFSRVKARVFVEQELSEYETLKIPTHTGAYIMYALLIST